MGTGVRASRSAFCFLEEIEPLFPFGFFFFFVVVVVVVEKLFPFGSAAPPDSRELALTTG